MSHNRKVLLSFLGTGKYIECNYYINKKKQDEKEEIVKKVGNVKYIQEALVKLFCSGWTENDQVIIFTTESAKTKHWRVSDPNNDINRNNSTNNSNGLEERLKLLNYKTQINAVDIPEGKNEEELWQLFEIIYNQLKPNDEIIFDITHSFRSLPLITIIILIYSKVMKNIKIKGLYYGAFNVLGKISDVENMPLEERNAPIFDLTPFIQLVDWTIVVNNFLLYGDLSKASQIVQSKKEEKFIKDLENFTQSFETNRLMKIVKKQDFKGLKKRIRRFKKNDTSSKMMNQLIERMYEKVKDFENESIENGYLAVKWCIDHNLIQQAYTILQENMINELMLKFYPEEDITDQLKRSIISGALQQVNYQKTERSNGKEEEGKEKENTTLNDYELYRRKEITRITEKIDSEFAKIYTELSELRNDINHAGMRQKYEKSSVIIKKIRDIFIKLQSLKERKIN